MTESRIARWSQYLIYFILAVLPLERIPSFEASFPIHATIRLSQLAGLALILINLPLMLRSWRTLTRRPWVFLVGFWLVCLVSSVLSGHLHGSLTVTLFTIFVGVLAWAIALRFDLSQASLYLKIILFSALAVCAFGFYQFFGDLLGLPIGWTGLRGEYTKSVFGFPRIQSTALEPLYFGNYLLIPASLAIVAIVQGWYRRLVFWSLIPIATVVWLTVSRGAIVALGAALAIGLVAAIVKRQFRRGAELIVAAAISIGLAFGLLYVGTHYFNATKSVETTHAIANFSKQTTNITSGESSEGRTVTRKLAFEAFKTRPLIGIGPGGFGIYATAAMPDRFSGTSAIVNNEPLELLAETGLLGTGLLLAFFASLIWSTMRLGKLPESSTVIAYGIPLALVAIALQYQTFSTLYITHLWVATGLLAGLSLSVAAGSAKSPARK